MLTFAPAPHRGVTALLHDARWLAAVLLLAVFSLPNQAQATIITLAFVDPPGAGDVQFIATADAEGPTFTITSSTFSQNQANVLGYCSGDLVHCSDFIGKYSVALKDPFDGTIRTLVTVSWVEFTSTYAFELTYETGPALSIGPETWFNYPLAQWQDRSASNYCNQLLDAACTMPDEFIFRLGTGVIGIVDPVESTPEPASVGVVGLALAALALARYRHGRRRSAASRRQR